ncbi:hypothetical protein ASD8599_01571 [Ascidiaceihabitans donghaensis]|uniref:Uncharacterized protein n=1 Tax=Ascidiaceihabitans donghaensis TaxID=1510460 RepID=A0A2R8BCT0_9RHOB|nr:hypothetical protein [Ascidiaceihabitans donghaensis]SPH20830.1 hypothetical protein ASD8599_01571 [Ascidiaceihabitans donghaensis]
MAPWVLDVVGVVDVGTVPVAGGGGLGEQAAEAVGFRGLLADVEVIELQSAFDVGELDFCGFGYRAF